jgi:hypothetical protein
MTNTQKKKALEEARNPVQNRIRYQKRLQEEKEAAQRMKEELTRLTPEELEEDARRLDE